MEPASPRDLCNALARSNLHPIRAFFDKDKAEAFCEAREDDAWEGINPFRYGSRED